MSYPPLVAYSSQDDYRRHFQGKYCKKPLLTFDGIAVIFTHRDFDHAFFESSLVRGQRKDVFSKSRAERIDWIEVALAESDAELYCGWDKRKKTYTAAKRLALVNRNYLVIIRITGENRARFVTAFVVDNVLGTLLRIRTSPEWYVLTKKDR